MPAKSGLTAAIIGQATLTVLRPQFWTLFAVAAPFTLLIDMVLAVFGPEQPRTVAELTPRVALILVIIPAFIGAIAQLAVAAMIARPEETPRRALAAALAVLPTYVLVLLLSALPTALGLLLLVVPGLYIAARLFLVVPAAVLEGAGATETLRRSWDLTEGDAWTIAGFMVLAILMLLGLSFLAAGVGSAIASILALAGLKTVGVFVSALLAAVLATVFSVASAAASTVIYLKLK